MNHLSISSPSIVDTYSHFVLKGFLLKPFEQKPRIKWAFSSSEGFYLLLKIQNSKLLIQVLTKFTDQPSLFSQNHSLFFLFFFYQNNSDQNFIVSKGCENRALAMSLSHTFVVELQMALIQPLLK